MSEPQSNPNPNGRSTLDYTYLYQGNDKTPNDKTPSQNSKLVIRLDNTNEVKLS